MIDLSTISTAELVAELSKRAGVEYADIECEDGIAKNNCDTWMGAGMTDELCPQFGIIGAACSDPETFCDQYVFCKRARELQKEPSTIPQWAIDAIEKEIFGLWEEYAKTGITRLDACARKLEWVLSLRKPEDTE